MEAAKEPARIKSWLHLWISKNFGHMSPKRPGRVWKKRPAAFWKRKPTPCPRRHERNAQCAGTGAGYYEREFQARAGMVHLKIPKLRHAPFEATKIERYRHRKSSDVPSRDFDAADGGYCRGVMDNPVSPSTISDLDQTIFERVEAWRNCPLEKEYAYVRGRHLVALMLKAVHAR